MNSNIIISIVMSSEYWKILITLIVSLYILV